MGVDKRALCQCYMMSARPIEQIDSEICFAKNLINYGVNISYFDILPLSERKNGLEIQHLFQSFEKGTKIGKLLSSSKRGVKIARMP